MTNPETPSLPLAKSESVASSSGAWSDWVGVIASIGCAVHCAAMPFVIAYLPALGLSFLADEAFHQWMAVGCFGIALAAFVPGFRQHGRFTPVVIAAFGLAMISVAAFGFTGECCPSCAGVSPNGTGSGVTSAGAPTCTNTDCALCTAPSKNASATDSDPPRPDQALSGEQASSWLTSAAPWLTPIGGIVLVSAHLLNRRHGRLCGCCENDSTKGAAG